MLVYQAVEQKIFEETRSGGLCGRRIRGDERDRDQHARHHSKGDRVGGFDPIERR